MWRSVGNLGVLVLLSVLLSVNCNAPTGPVFRKGVTLAGDYSQFTANNFAILHQILNTRAGVIGVNLPWDAATTTCPSGCTPQRPSNPTDWNDPQYSNSPTVQALDAITGYVSKYGGGAFVMGVTYGTPQWAACPGDPTSATQPNNYPPQNAADYGNFMYAMSERYSGNHVNNSSVPIGKIRDWVVYNEVNSPAWWKNTA